MKNYIFQFLMGFFILFASCKDEGDCCTPWVYVENFSFSVVNANQVDLLNPETDGSLNTPRIRIYECEYENERYVTINLPNRLDASRGYHIYGNEEEEELFSMSLYISEEKVTGDLIEKKGIIKWDYLDQDIIKQDTIKIELIQANANVQRLKKITFNDNEVWNRDSSQDNIAYFKIIK